jgi:hypothetical protein
MLCEHALEAFDRYGVYSEDASVAHRAALQQGFIKAGTFSQSVPNGTPRGMLVNYETLPGFVPNVLLSLFGVNADPIWVRRMQMEALEYSKSSSKNFLKAGKFSGDSRQKEDRASAAVEQFANAILGPSYDKMLNITESVMSLLTPKVTLPRDAGGRVKWAQLKPIIAAASTPGAAYEALPFNPFEATHNSSAFEVIAFD